jgi:hypothetical protein
MELIDATGIHKHNVIFGIKTLIVIDEYKTYLYTNFTLHRITMLSFIQVIQSLLRPKNKYYIIIA